MIKLENVSKKFRLTRSRRIALGTREQQIKAIGNLSFELEQGKILLVLGTAGAGKSTLLELLAGIYPPDTGTLTIHQQKAEKKITNIGWLSSEGLFFEKLTVLEHLQYLSALQQIPKAICKERIPQLLIRWQLEEVKNKKVAALSALQKRYLNIATAMLNDPDLLLLDEPALGLDVFSLHPIVDLMQEVKQQNKTLVMATNQLIQTKLTGDQVLILHQGKAVFYNTMAAFQEQRASASLPSTFIQLIESVNA